MHNLPGYKFLIPFIESNLPVGFRGINPDDKIVQMMEEKLCINKQFIYVADVIQLKILYTSKCSYDFFGPGIDPADASAYLSAAHPDDLKRHSIARNKYLRIGTDLFVEKKGEAFISTNIRVKNASGNYVNLLYQGYLFYSELQYPSTYAIMVHTDVTGMMKARYGYHYYVGNDPAYFRFPDDTLLKTGNVFSRREFEIIKLIACGHNSRKIAEELFLSIHTVNTHRRNLLKKTGKATTHELVMELKEGGVI
jgi:DNA-binding CsgD family transcriptional regulator